MKAFKINLGDVMPRNSRMALPLASNINKGPYKPEYVYINKSSYGQMFYDFANSKNLNIEGNQIDNIHSYSVLDYADVSTQHGKLYNILTDDSNISLYTKDDKFSSINRYYNNKRTIKIGNKPLNGDITETINSDGSKTYKIITSKFRVRTFVIQPDGTILEPNNKVKTIQKLVTSKIKSAINLLKN